MDSKILDRIKQWLTDEAENPISHLKPQDESIEYSQGRVEASRDLLDFIYEMETKGIDYEESEDKRQ